MNTRQPANLPIALSAARRQLDQWRSRHRKRTRLRKELWRRAATLLREHGLNKTENGARVGDLFMSLIHSCELNKVNPFEYLTELQKHVKELSSDPDSWMPWNHRDMLQRTNAP